MDKKISNKISPDIRNHEEVSAEFEYLPRLKKMPDTDLHRMGSKDVQRSESIGHLSDVDLEEETYRLPNVRVDEEVPPEFEYLPRLKKCQILIFTEWDQEMSNVLSLLEIYQMLIWKKIHMVVKENLENLENLKENLENLKENLENLENL